MEWYVIGGVIVVVIILALVAVTRNSNKNTGHGLAAPVVPSDPTVDDLVREGDKHMADREYGQAHTSYSNALEQARNDYGKDDPRLAAVLLKVGEADQQYYGEDYDEDTVPTEFLEALAILDRAHGPMEPQVLPALRLLISFYDEIGNHGKSQSIIWRLQEIERQTTPPSA